jgi:hypothetical protein
MLKCTTSMPENDKEDGDGTALVSALWRLSKRAPNL